MLTLTGSLRSIANSAWISTLKESSAASRSDEDVLRVVNYLVSDNHTSPFESVSLTFSPPIESVEMSEISDYIDDKLCCSDYAKLTIDEWDRVLFTIDLLNFLKAVKLSGKLGTLWEHFERKATDLAGVVSKFRRLALEPPDDVSGLIGSTNMSVEIVESHLVGHREHDRVTWRARIPLAIAVQLLRHRSGSYNMLSGRYKTIYHKMYSLSNDCNELFDKIGESQDKFMSAGSDNIFKYRAFMKRAKEARDSKTITNDEYKRVREVARFILPEGRMTELYITYYLSDYYDTYSKLRNSKHAQVEHIWLAQEMDKTLNRLLLPQ